MIPTLQAMSTLPYYQLGATAATAWVVNWTDSAGVDWIVTKETGWSDAPSARSDTDQSAWGDGETAGPVQYGPRFITLTGEAVAPDRASAAAARDRFLGAGASSRFGVPLTVTDIGGARQAMVRRDGDAKTVSKGSRRFGWEITLRAADPAKYDVNTTTVTIPGLVPDPGGGLTFPFTFPFVFAASGASTGLVRTLTNTGTLDTPLRAVFTGPWTDPGIYSATLGVGLSFQLTLGAGETLTVITAPPAALLSGGSSALGQLRPGFRFFRLPPGASDVGLRGAGGAGSSCVLTFQSAWL